MAMLRAVYETGSLPWHCDQQDSLQCAGFCKDQCTNQMKKYITESKYLIHHRCSDGRSLTRDYKTRVNMCTDSNEGHL
jgi:hypothetical protein